MIVADTGAVYALIDAGERHHRVLRRLFESDPDAWVLPWVILPEVDYLVGKRLGRKVEEEFLEDLADGAFAVAWGDEADVAEARRICRKHRDLRLGLVDACVMAVAERMKAGAIATLDVRDFGAVELKGAPKLYPRDLRAAARQISSIGIGAKQTTKIRRTAAATSLRRKSSGESSSRTGGCRIPMTRAIRIQRNQPGQ